ncbi:MAG: hypothetical protein JXA09_00725 [Anaerolineae bacterium]|nr:hypothetical protein [Anaerolineae bacterium]
MDRRQVQFAALLLTLGMLVACVGQSPAAPPTRTPAQTIPVPCTPPSCDASAGEVLHCPHTCPQGCGLICTTATPASPPPLLPSPTGTPVSPPTRLPSPTAIPTPVSPSTPTPEPSVALPTPVAVPSLPAPPISLVLDPTGKTGAYALLQDQTLYQSVDGGESWRQVALPALERQVDGGADPGIHGQRDLVMTRVRPHRIYVRAGDALYRRAEGEDTWTPLLDAVGAWAVDGWGGTHVYAWRQANVTHDSPGGAEASGLYRSRDGGENWALVYAGASPAQDQPHPEQITSLLIDPWDPSLLYAGADDGMYRSLDAGCTWARFEPGLPETTEGSRSVPLLLSGPEGRVYALTEASPVEGIAHTQAIVVRLDHGTVIPDQDRWTVLGADVLAMLVGAESGFSGVHTLAVDPEQPGQLYLGTTQGLWRSVDDGHTWMPADLGGGPEARPVGAVYRIAVRSAPESELVFWSETGLHIHDLDGQAPLPWPVAHEVRFDTIGQVGGQSRAVAVTSGAIYLGIGPRIAGLVGTRLAALGAFGFSPPLPGIVHDIVLDQAGTVAYVAAGDAGLLIVDLSFLPIARVIGQVETRYPADALVVREGLAFVAEATQVAQGGLSIVDVAVADMPWLVSWHKLPGSPGGIALSGDIVYLAYDTGLVAIDISDPVDPFEVSRTRLSDTVSSLALAGHYLYLTGDRLRVLDVADPAQPRPVGALTVPGAATDRVVVADGIAYLAQVTCEFGTCGSVVHIVDLADPARPTELGLWSTQTVVEDLAVANQIIYLASWQAGVEAVDVRDPANPRFLSAYGTLGEVVDVVVEDGFAYVSDGAHSGIRTLDLATSPRGRVWPTLRGIAETSWASGYAVRGGWAYVPVGNDGLRIVDLGDPDAPRERAALDLGVAAAQAAIAGDVVFVSASGALVAVDVSDSAAPRELSRFAVDGEALGVAVRDGIAYLAVQGMGDGDRGTLYTVDVHEPTRLRQLGAERLAGTGLRVSLAGAMAYVAVLDPSSTTPTGGLQAIDISDPAQPRRAGWLWLPNAAFDVQVMDERAYVADGEAGIYVIDVSDPTELRAICHVDTPGSARRIALAGDQVYVADGPGGLHLLRVTPASR